MQIVEEAGGLVSRTDGEKYCVFDRSVLASNGALHDKVSFLPDSCLVLELQSLLRILKFFEPTECFCIVLTCVRNAFLFEITRLWLFHPKTQCFCICHLSYAASRENWSCNREVEKQRGWFLAVVQTRSLQDRFLTTSFLNLNAVKILAIKFSRPAAASVVWSLLNNCFLCRCRCLGGSEGGLGLLHFMAFQSFYVYGFRVESRALS